MDATMRIAEVARRSGFTPATLRYYEEINLLPAPARTASGYRSYDGSVLDRLTFIARAKSLGCSLEEIAGLLPRWDGRRCAPLQDRLRTLVEAKLGAAEVRVAELTALTHDLRRVHDGLASHTPDGPCDSECGCVGDSPAPPVACTLEVGKMPGRLQEWDNVLADVRDRRAIAGGVRLEFGPTTDMNGLIGLVGSEQSCCSFFAFAITVDSRGVGLEVRAPAEAQPFLTSLFGAPSPTSCA